MCACYENILRILCIVNIVCNVTIDSSFFLIFKKNSNAVVHICSSLLVHTDKRTNSVLHNVNNHKNVTRFKRPTTVNNITFIQTLFRTCTETTRNGSGKYRLLSKTGKKRFDFVRYIAEVKCDEIQV